METGRMSEDDRQPDAVDATTSKGEQSPLAAGYTIVSTRQTRKRRGFETARDMVWSLATIAVLIGVILALNWRPTPDAVREVDWRPVVEAARQALAWPVLAPGSDLEGWTSTSARNEPVPGDERRVFIGWVTPTGEFASLQQSTLEGTERRSWLRNASRQGRTVTIPAGSDVGVVSAGSWTDTSDRTWQTLESVDGGQRTLVREVVQDGREVTYLVTGTASWNELQQLATSLRDR
jgi:hypothetical protein